MWQAPNLDISSVSARIEFVRFPKVLHFMQFSDIVHVFGFVNVTRELENKLKKLSKLEKPLYISKKHRKTGKSSWNTGNTRSSKADPYREVQFY